MIEAVPDLRINSVNQKPINPEGNHVVYWMVAHRRMEWNFSLQHAIHTAQKFNRPLIVLEALRMNYRWASDRTHQFIIEGMQDNRKASANTSVLYYPFVETHKNEGKGLLEALAEDAICVITDEFPCFFIPRMQKSAARKLNVSLQTVDTNGILPLRAAGRVFTTAASFRRHLQKTIMPHMSQIPEAKPLAHTLPEGMLPNTITDKWPITQFDNIPGLTRSLDIDHEVKPVPFSGGSKSAQLVMAEFMRKKLPTYHLKRNNIDESSASGLSPYLHFGHLSAHELVQNVLKEAKWRPENVAPKASGSREGWWGTEPWAEALLDQIITWRELGYVFCFERPDDFDTYESLPDWAKKTLKAHHMDSREHVYSLRELENALTHDPIWNAAQTQLRQEGRIHNYLRMLWGKKVLEWSKTPQDALKNLIELNNRWAIDGRNPNSYSGIFWTLGRFDRAWGERQVFGKIRFMSSQSTARKLKLKPYLERYGESS